ncbi:hypothetical protein KUCAC02_034545, partial [Chaenocephalus aceratus]
AAATHRQVATPPEEESSGPGALVTACTFVGLPHFTVAFQLRRTADDKTTLEELEESKPHRRVRLSASRMRVEAEAPHQTLSVLLKAASSSQRWDYCVQLE